MPKIIDISVPLYSEMPIWPGSVGLQISRVKCIERGDPVNVSKIDCDIHIGTHIDAPLHFIRDGASIEKIPLDLFCGPAFISALTQVDSIKANDLATLSLPKGINRLLLKTRNSELWKKEQQDFDPGYVALTVDAAKWIIDQGIHLIGVDYLSVQRYHDKPETHVILLRAEVIIIEGLNLANVTPGWYELICLPLKLMGTEGAPARAVLRRMDAGSWKP
ncbi:Kynurenine formamidase [subsurface metagenome]